MYIDCVSAHKGPEMVLDFLELESQMVVGDPTCVLRTEPGFSAGTELALDC